jgi:hypothetical protein
MADRLAIGEFLYQKTPSPELARQLVTLRAALAKAQADPADRARCMAWRTAWEAWERAYQQVQKEMTTCVSQQPLF